MCEDIPLTSAVLKWSRENDRERQGRGRERERAGEPMGLLWDFSIMVPDPSVRPAQSSLMGSSQPQEDTELPSVPKALPKRWSALTVRNL